MERRKMICLTWQRNLWTVAVIFLIFFIGLQTVQAKVRTYCIVYLSGLNLLHMQNSIFHTNLLFIHSFV